MLHLCAGLDERDPIDAIRSRSGDGKRVARRGTASCGVARLRRTKRTLHHIRLGNGHGGTPTAQDR